MAYNKDKEGIWFYIWATILAIVVTSYVFSHHTHAAGEPLGEARGQVHKIKNCALQLDLYWNSCAKEILEPRYEECLKDKPLGTPEQVKNAQMGCGFYVRLEPKEQLQCYNEQISKFSECSGMSVPESIEEWINKELGTPDNN